jgi:hypothetical protein
VVVDSNGLGEASPLDDDEKQAAHESPTPVASGSVQIRGSTVAFGLRSDCRDELVLRGKRLNNLPSAVAGVDLFTSID